MKYGYNFSDEEGSVVKFAIHIQVSKLLCQAQFYVYRCRHEIIMKKFFAPLVKLISVRKHTKKIPISAYPFSCKQISPI